MPAIREVLRATLLRFLPTTVVGSFALIFFMAGADLRSVSAGTYIELAVLLVAVAAGFGAGLTALRSRLRADAQLDGRRSVIAGMLGIVGLVAAMRGLPMGSSSPHRLARSIGAMSAVLMFLPWVQSRDRITPGVPPLDAARAHAGAGEPAPRQP